MREREKEIREKADVRLVKESGGDAIAGNNTGIEAGLVYDGGGEGVLDTGHQNNALLLDQALNRHRRQGRRRHRPPSRRRRLSRRQGRRPHEGQHWIRWGEREIKGKTDRDTERKGRT